MEGWAKLFKHQLESALGTEVKVVGVQNVKSVRDEGCQSAPQIVLSSTSDLRERLKRADRELAGDCS